MIRRLVSRVVGYRPPDFVIGEPNRPYLLRWWLIPRNRWFNVYLHCILRSDDDRALHDHPWANCSIILGGRYWEVTEDRVRCRKRGSVTFRRAATAHRLVVREPCWSLFITGPKTREWGFLVPLAGGGHRWVHWEAYVDPVNPGVRR